MDDKKVARINELYHKSKSEGLTPEELKEQPVSYTHLTLPTNSRCISRWSPYH